MRLGETKKGSIGRARSTERKENWKPLLLVALICAAAITSGCTGVVTATSGSATIQLNPASVSFGNVTVGKTSSQTVTILNAGTASVTITQATVSNTQFNVSGIALPLTVGAGQSATATVSVAPTASGPISGTLSVQGASGAAPVVVNLTATGVATNPQISVSNSAINFGNVTVNTQASSNLTISNTGNADLTVSLISASGTGFGATGITTPKVISAGQSTTMSVTFNPATATALSGTLTITSNDPVKPTTTVTLSGTGTAAPVGNLQANQGSLSFGNVGTGTSAVQQITLTNTGTSSVQISAITITGTGFSQSGVAVPTTLNPSATATLSVTFAPTAAGAVSGSLTITSNGSGSPLTISVSGTGVQAGLSVSPASFNFGSILDGQTKSQTFTITNTGTATLAISQVSIGAAGYSVNGLSATSVAPGATATFNAVFAPTTAGSLAGSVSIASNAPTSPSSVALTGTGVAVNPQISVSNTAINFGNVTVNTQGTSNLTISNTGNADLTVSLISVGGTGFGATGITTPKVISAGQSATMSVTFSPATATASSGTLTITSNDPVKPTTTVTLSGTGTAAPVGNLQANQNSLSYGNVGTGTSSAQQITLTNTGTASVQITGVTVTGAGFSATGVAVPTTLNPSATATLSVTFAPTAAGAVSGSVAIASNGSGSPLTIGLSGTGVQAGLSVSPSSFNFGSVIDGQTKSQAFTITNTGTATLTISQVSISGAGYTVNGLSSTSVAPGATATFNAVFAPTTAGSLSGSVSIASNAPASPATVAVSGTGVAVAQTLSFSSASLAFGNVNTGSSSTQNVTITNTGNTSVQITQISASGTGYTLSGVSTPATLNPSQTLTFGVVFAPTTAGTASGSVTVTSNATGSPATIALSGTGAQPGLTVSPTSFSFGSVIDGQTKSQSFTLTNSGTASLTISQLSISAPGYTVNGLSVPSTLAAGASTTFSAVFMPTTVGSLTGTVSIVSNAPNSPATVALSGTGVAPTQTLSFSSSSLAFGSVNTGTSSTLSETLTNTGNSSVTVSQIGISGTGYSLTGAGTPVTLNPGQTLTFNVVFDPTTSGALSGTVTVTSNASGSPATITLSGTGVTVVTHSVGLNWTASTSTVSGYNVYRSLTSGSGYVIISTGLVSTASYTDSSVQSGKTYYYVTTSVDSTGLESTFSNEASAVIP